MGGSNSRQDSRGYLLLSKEEETTSIETEVNDQASANVHSLHKADIAKLFVDFCF